MMSLPVRVIVDASAAVELVLRTAAGWRVDTALRRASRLIAPSHLDAEVLSALGRMSRAGDIAESVVEPALRHLVTAPIMRFPAALLVHDAWALRHNIALRDALYVALARHLDARLVTADKRLARAPELGISVTVV